MRIREKLKYHGTSSYEEWRRNLHRQFIRLVGGISIAWIAAGLFTVWLLRG